MKRNFPTSPESLLSWWSHSVLTMVDRAAQMGSSWKNVIIIRTDIISPRSNDNSNALTPHSTHSRHNRYLSVGQYYKHPPWITAARKTPFMTCRWHSNCFMQLIEREWIMGVQEPAVLCRALQHHWGWQLAWLQLGNDPYLNCNKTKLIAEQLTEPIMLSTGTKSRYISLLSRVCIVDWIIFKGLTFCIVSCYPLFKHIDGKRLGSSFSIRSGWQKIFTQTFQHNQAALSV